MKWKKIHGYSDYKISDTGLVYDLFCSREIKPTLVNTGYLCVSLRKSRNDGVDRKLELVHRLLALTFLGEKDQCVDHIDGNKLNNCLENLRWCTRSQNAFNAKNKTGVSRYKGVSKSGNGWRAYIMIDYKQKHLGSYKTEAEAGKAYNDYAVRVLGDFAKLNQI